MRTHHVSNQVSDMNALRFIPLALVLISCASQPEVAVVPPPPPSQPVIVALAVPGNYEFATAVQGQVVSGTMTITGTPGAYEGRILTSAFPEIPITGATLAGQDMTVRGNMNGGELVLKLKFEGQKFTGTWELGGDGGEFSGRKLAQ